MKLTVLLIPLIFLSSCTFENSAHIDTRIIALETEIQSLKTEINLLKTNIPPITSADPLAPDMPDRMQFEESSNAECLEAARRDFLESGNKQCYQIGKTDADIKNGKCKLSQPIIKALSEKKTQAELQCGTMR
jgi:hypothetical protein